MNQPLMQRTLVTTVLLVAALGLAGCSMSSSSSQPSQPSQSDGSGKSDGSGNSGSSGSSGSRAPVAGLEKATDSSNSFSTTGAAQRASARSVITTGRIAITVDTPLVAAEKAVTITAAAGGHVDGRTERPSTGGDPASAQLVLRIPSATLDATLAELKKLGRVENVSLATQDVTGQSQDLEARITALTTSVGRLVELMSRASSTADLISIETALSDRQASLESLQAEKRGLDDQVDLATLTVEFGTIATAPVRAPDTFLSGLSAGWGSFVAFLSAALVVAGVVLPWLVFAAVIAAIATLGVRRRRIRSIRIAREP